jgi:hypothetical protein
VYTKFSQAREAISTDEHAALFAETAAGLPDPEWADSTAVVRLPALLSREEVAAIHAAAKAAASDCGTTARDAHGIYKVYIYIYRIAATAQDR